MRGTFNGEIVLGLDDFCTTPWFNTLARNFKTYVLCIFGNNMF